MSDPTAPLAAALWDFDGTLADTEPIWIEGEFELIGQLGGQWSIEHAHQLVGNSLLDSGAYILNTIGRHDLTPEWVVDWLVSYVVDRVTHGPMPWRPGAFELLQELRAAERALRPGLGVLPGPARRRSGPAAPGHVPGLGGR